MRGSTTLLILIALGSALSWLPVAREPNLDLSSWIPTLCAAICTGLSTVLYPRYWLFFLYVSGLATAGGFCLGFAIWPPDDGIARSYLLYALALETSLAVVASFLASLAVRPISVLLETNRTAVWVALACVVSFGPAALLLMPPLIERRIANNDRLAAERFVSLKKAVERTTAEASNPSSVCDGSALRHYYNGPSFSDEDWRRITGNYVKRDGYTFMVYCREKNGYTIDAHPARRQGDGTRQFCTDESRKQGCRMEWSHSRYACLPCATEPGGAQNDN